MEHHAEGGTTTNVAIADPGILAERRERFLFVEGVAVVDRRWRTIEIGGFRTGTKAGSIRAGQRNGIDIEIRDPGEVFNDDPHIGGSEIGPEKASVIILPDVRDSASG